MNLLRPPEAPAWVVFQLLERCNLRCSMCYQWGEGGAYHERTALAELEPAVLLRTIRECLPARPYFEFFGGEPLLYRGLWDAIRLIREGGCELAFPTNGTLLEECAERLLATPPTRLWISLDGPAAINDQQRGAGVFARATRGLAALAAGKRARGSRLPELGIACVVTPLNHRQVARLFLEELDLSQLSCVSLELQSWATAEQHAQYARVVREQFGVTRTPCAQAYVRDPALFAGIDAAALAADLARVREACAAHGLRFFSQPGSLDAGNLGSYLAGRWDQLTDRRERCAFPWASAEISARGEVTPCHSFYDLSIGSIYQQPLLEIWRGARLAALRDHLRKGLFSICTACCRYYAHTAAPPAAPEAG